MVSKPYFYSIELLKCNFFHFNQADFLNDLPSYNKENFANFQPNYYRSQVIDFIHKINIKANNLINTFSNRLKHNLFFIVQMNTLIHR